MFKKCCVCLLALLLVALLPTAALADVIWEPYDNDFYTEHSADCLYEGRSYEVRDTIPVYEEPGKVGDGSLPPGTKVDIAFIYTDADGIQWGVIDADKSYWLPMGRLRLLYDNIWFTEEYGAEFQPCKEQPSADFYAQEQQLFEYPGSYDLTPLTLADDRLPTISVTYTDGYGCVWGRIDYYMGLKGWLLLSDPHERPVMTDTSATFAASDGDTGTDNSPTDGESAAEPDDADRETKQDFILPAILVVAVVVVTLIVILVLFGDKRKRLHRGT